jgi:hypothetical protein
LEQIPGTVTAVGDLAYPDGSRKNFQCYDRTWGRARTRTRPAPGNHEFHAAGATPYFDYFGAAAGDPKYGYYSYELGTWHIVVLNSECQDIGGCDTASLELQWLRADLAAHPAACTLAYWHKPLFSSGSAPGTDPEMKPLWQALYDGNADVVINGHDHNYERFAPQNPDGGSDAARRIREFVVGTGGKNHRPIVLAKPNRESRNAKRRCVRGLEANFADRSVRLAVRSRGRKAILGFRHWKVPLGALHPQPEGCATYFPEDEAVWTSKSRLRKSATCWRVAPRGRGL